MMSPLRGRSRTPHRLVSGDLFGQESLVHIIYRKTNSTKTRHVFFPGLCFFYGSTILVLLIEWSTSEGRSLFLLSRAFVESSSESVIILFSF